MHDQRAPLSGLSIKDGTEKAAGVSSLLCSLTLIMQPDPGLRARLPLRRETGHRGRRSAKRNPCRIMVAQMAPHSTSVLNPVQSGFQAADVYQSV
jgi:hypothetical protein